MELFGFIAWFLVWFCFSIGVAAFAASRGRSGFVYFLLSCFFSPLLVLILLLVMRNLREDSNQGLGFRAAIRQQ